MKPDVARVALIAHDEKKPALVEIVQAYEDILSNFDLVGTGTTAKRLMRETDLNIERKRSGSVGGDVQIAAEVVEGDIDGVIFLRDPSIAQPHEADINALLRACTVHNVPIASVPVAAEFLIEALYRKESYNSGWRLRMK